MPFADLTERIQAEQTAASQLVAEWSPRTSLEAGTVAGPWIELLYRKLEGDEWKRRLEQGMKNIAELPRRKIDGRFLERAA